MVGSSKLSGRPHFSLGHRDRFSGRRLFAAAAVGITEALPQSEWTCLKRTHGQVRKHHMELDLLETGAHYPCGRLPSVHNVSQARFPILCPSQPALSVPVGRIAVILTDLFESIGFPGLTWPTKTPDIGNSCMYLFGETLCEDPWWSQSWFSQDSTDINHSKKSPATLFLNGFIFIQ